MKLGIVELKDVVSVGLKIGEAVSDGFGWEDLIAFRGLPAAIDGIKNVPAELKDLDEEETAELKQFVIDNFDIPDDKVEKFIETAIGTVLDIYRLVNMFKELKE